MKTTHKTARTIKEYNTILRGHPVTVPAGSVVSNSTACGNDDNYRFWEDWKKHYGDKVQSHDLHYQGLNVPAEYCEPYT